MKLWKLLPFTTALVLLHAQSPPTSVPLYRVTVVQGSAKAINYRDLGGSTKVDLKGTILLPGASGIASMKSKKDGIHITAKFKDLPSASTFGGEYLTYVMWGISTEGRAVNLGELILKGGKGKLEAIEQLQTFGLVITAEPYFAVGQPSNVVVLENHPRAETMGRVERIDARYELLKRGQYTLNLEDTQPITLDPGTPFAVYQARNAVRIAQAAGASAFAPDAYEKAANFLQRSENTQIDEKNRILLARDATQMAEDSRLIAVQKQVAEWEAMEAKLAQNRLDAAHAETARATEAQNAAIQQKEAATAAQNVAIQQKEAATAQNSVLQTTNTGLQGTNADLQASNIGLQSTNAGLESRNEGLQARNENLRTRLADQLKDILETRSTSRGLIMSMSGLLFQNGKAILLPAAKEKLAKVAGVLSTYKGLEIEAHGYTDSVGNDASNLRLSEQRASNTRDYLVSQGVPMNAVSFVGFGEGSPIATNATSLGRQQNRRVELVVSGDGLTDPTYLEE